MTSLHDYGLYVLYILNDYNKNQNKCKKMLNNAHSYVF